MGEPGQAPLVEMASIKHNPAGQPLPDFRNLGVMLRILLGVNVFALAAALVQSRDPGDWVQRYVDMAASVQPLLLLNLSLLALFARGIRLLPVRYGQLAVCLLSVVTTILLADFWRFMGFDEGGGWRVVRASVLGGLAAGAMLFYFELRARGFSPAVNEARLQALTARIRPHFLFNSLNAVLSLIRSDPRRAESALEELADLFRVLMRDHRELLPLGDEIALCRQYLELEKLRLGDRLTVIWEVSDVPADVKVPPLMLQPLLENAVYHGIEPSSEPGTVRIAFARRGDELHIDLANPCGESGESAKGNHMALANIRERLTLYYDLEARLEAGETVSPDGVREYRVHITLPCRKS